MKQCIECGTENTDTAVVCAKCGKPLTGAPTGNRSTIDTVQYQFVDLQTQETDNELVTLLTCPTLPEADVVVSHLEAAGIPASVPDEYKMLAAPWDLIKVKNFRVQIPPEHYEAAREVLLTNVDETKVTEAEAGQPGAVSQDV
jgi:hypothetical protein